jgi:hypothetical protein
MSKSVAYMVESVQFLQIPSRFKKYISLSQNTVTGKKALIRISHILNNPTASSGL